MLNPLIEVGAIVRHENCPEWGLGQVQSVVGDRVTVNFENSGKIVMQGPEIPLELVLPDHL